MKQTLLLILLALLFVSKAEAQKPEPIYGFARVQKPLDWYQEQSKAWGKVLEKDPGNALAWWYYYRVNRNLYYANHKDSVAQKRSEAVLDKVQQDIEKHIPGTYEYNLIKWVYNGNNFDSVKYLVKAVELGENRIEAIDYMMNWAEIDRDKEKRDKWSKKWLASGEYSPGLLYYNYNVLAGAKPNAIIITGGDNDTYPIWLLQSRGIRKDVTVINTSLITIDSYRKKIFAELGIEGYKAIWPNNSYDEAEHKKLKEQLIGILASNKKKYPVYVGLTVNEHFRKQYEEALYLTGLALEYSKNSIDNIAALKKNFEKEYALDYLDKAFFEDISEDRVQVVSLNYLAPMLKLYDHYKEADDRSKMEWLKSKILFIVKGREEEADVKKHLGV